MKCTKCNYVFSEEKRTCPKCGADMGMILEKLGYFPQSSEEPFFTVDDFREKSSISEIEEKKETREIEFHYSEE